MKRLKAFFTLTLLGGMAVVLPLTIFLVIFQWLFVMVTGAIQPLTDWLTTHTELKELFADIIVVFTIVVACFVIGLLVKTGIGRWLHGIFDQALTKLAPGYRVIRELVSQFLGSDDSASLFNGKVCKARIYGVDNPVEVTAIITDEYQVDGLDILTVFVPTAPIPTSGMVYHLPSDCVQLLPDISVEVAMKTVIACGAGSKSLNKQPERG